MDFPPLKRNMKLKVSYLGEGRRAEGNRQEEGKQK